MACEEIIIYTHEFLGRRFLIVARIRIDPMRMRMRRVRMRMAHHRGVFVVFGAVASAAAVLRNDPLIFRIKVKKVNVPRFETCRKPPGTRDTP